MPHKGLVVLFAFLSTGAQAQWLNYPTPGTPRTRDGKPDLAAPVPRAPDGKPDLTGVWMHEITTVAEVRRLFGDRFEAAIIDRCINNAIMSTGVECLCQDQRVALISCQTDAGAHWRC